MMDYKEEIQTAEHLYTKGRPDEAKTLFESILLRDSGSYEAHNNLGVIYYGQGNVQKAEDSFKKAISIKNDYSDALLNLADLYQNTKRLTEAASLLEKLISHDGEDVNIYNRIGTLHLESGNNAKAHEILNKSLEIDPNQEIVRESLELINNIYSTRVKSKYGEKMNLLFLELPGTSTGGFLDHIVDYSKKTYNVKYAITSNYDEISDLVQWADIVWLEWGNQMAIHVTNNVPQIKNKRVICRIHGYEVFTDMPAHIKWEMVDHLIFVAKHKQDIFNQKFKVKSPPQSVIRNGVVTSKFSIATKKSNTKNLVLIGHLNFRKGLPTLLQFYHELLKKDPDFRLFIRGEFQDPRLEMACRTMIKELKIEDKIEFVRWVKDLNQWLADKSHILSFSLEESFHYAVGDGMAAGLKPVIHAWRESREIWPNEFIFRNLEEFLQLVLDRDYTPRHYRTILSEFGLGSMDQLSKVEKILDPSEKLNKKSIKTPSENNKILIPKKKANNFKLKRNIFIIGLRRSGTTIFWETFRQDKRFTCFDEPFRPHLRGYVEQGHNDKKKTMDEYLIHSNIIKNYWSHIQPYEETLTEFICHQKNYLNALLDVSKHVCIDFVRCHYKINALRKIDPDALIIHLVRDPRAFVTSHLKPYGQWISPSLPMNFFSYDGWFDYWHYQTLSNVLRFEGFAHEKLLKIWKLFTDTAESQHPDMTVQFELFATNPEEIMERIYELLGLDYSPLDYSKIHNPNSPFQVQNEEWRRSLDKEYITNRFLFEDFPTEYTDINRFRRQTG